MIFPGAGERSFENAVERNVNLDSKVCFLTLAMEIACYFIEMTL